MELKNLSSTYPQLLSHMEKAGYSKDYIKAVGKEIQRILAENETRNYTGYSDVCEHYKQTLNTHNSYKQRRAQLGIIMEFDLHGKLPDGRDSELIKKGAYTRLEPEFKALVDHLRQTELDRGVEKTTVNVWKNEASCFLNFLQEAGVRRLIDVKEELVLSFFISSDMKPVKGSSYRWTIDHFLKTCLPLDRKGCGKARSFIPMLRRTRKNIQYLTPDEHQKILDALGDVSNALTLRDRAIGQIAVHYGMRSGDIAALELDSIDWDRDIIRIVQRKTQQPLELPLLTVAGNAIHDYKNQERPASICPALFLTWNAPFRGITGEGVWRASESIMNAAGIRQEKGDRKGFHISRHHLVTALMGKGVQQPVISAIAGHINPRSIETYSYASHADLKDCALSVERFPVSLEVFQDAWI
jgi:integrase